MNSTSIIDEIRAGLERKRMSQAELARQVHMDHGQLSRILSGKHPIPWDLIRKASVIFGSRRLRAVWQEANDVGILNLGVLNNVDLNPAVVQFKLDEELREALEALRQFSLVNRRELSRDDAESLLGVLDQMADVVANVEHLVLAVQESFGVNPDEVKARWSRKVAGRGYRVTGDKVVRMVPQGHSAPVGA